MKKYKLIAIDMDGTLLTSDKKILEETKKDLHYAKENGTTVCICTGRGYPAIKRYIDEIELEMPLILYNGSRIRMSDNSRVIYNQVIDQDVAMKVYDVIEAHNGTCCFWKEDKLYFNKMDEYTNYYLKLTGISPIIVSSKEKELFSNINKFIWFATPEYLEEVKSNILVNVSGIDYFKSHSSLLEIVPPDVNKGHTLSELGKILGINQDEIIAIGDEENDLSMIKYAGLGVAMANAKPIVKENANYITLSNDENGVGEVIKKFII